MVSETIKFQEVVVYSGPLSHYNLGKIVINEIFVITLLVYRSSRGEEPDQLFDENGEGAIRRAQRSGEGSHAERW